METVGAISLVTGAAKRIGREIAAALADAGADVIVHYNSSRADAESTVEVCVQRGVRAWALQADLTDAQQTEALWREATRLAGTAPTILVNNASYYRRETLAQVEPTVFDSTMAVNVWAVLQLTQLMSGDLSRAGVQGCVVNINDRRSAYRTRFSYGISVAALSALTQSLAKSLPAHIRVNELRLGPVLPPDDRGADAVSSAASVPLVPIGSVTEAVLDLVRDESTRGTVRELTP